MTQRFGTNSIPIKLMPEVHEIPSEFRFNDVFSELYRNILFGKIIIFGSIFFTHPLHKFVIGHILATVFFNKVGKFI